MTFFVELNGSEPEPSVPPPEPPAPPPEPQIGVGQVLKTRRLELGLKHKDIARDIKIKADYLKAIEDEEFDSLPTPQYLRLFLKSYAEHLGLDVQEIYALYDTREAPIRKLEKKELRKDKEIPPPPPVVDAPPAVRRYGWVIAGGAAVVIVIVVVIALFMARKKTREAETGAEPVPINIVGDTSSALSETETQPPPVPARHQLDVRALDSAWMFIEADNDTAFWGTLKPGEVRTWTAVNFFKFSLSVSARAEARFDGQYLKPFLNWGRPIRAREIGLFNLEEYLDSTRLGGAR